MQERTKESVGKMSKDEQDRLPRKECGERKGKKHAIKPI